MLSLRLWLLSFSLIVGLYACKTSEETSKQPQTAMSDAMPVKSVKLTTVDSKKPQENQLKRPFFYKVEGPNNASGYLLGTMHMGVDAQKELPDSVWSVLNAAKVIVLEADMSDLSMAKAMLLPKDTNLRKKVGEETWALFVDTLGEDIANALMPMKPAAAASYLALQSLPQTIPMDLALLNYAKTEKKTLEFLETVDSQLDLLTQVMNVEFLTQMLKNPEDNDSNKLLKVYRSGNDAQLAQLLLVPEAWGGKENGAVNMKAMLYDRNANWVPKLQTLFKQPGVVVAVGAAHLVGNKSVIDLLQKAGYTVTKVAF